MDVRMPDGVIVRNVPDGMGKDELLARYERKKRMAALPQSLENAKETYSPLGTDAQNFAAGAGKAVFDLARGAGQVLGLVSNEDVAQSRALDAPLMETKAGAVGNVAGNIAALAPTAFIPGANTVAGASTIGAVSGLLQPATSSTERGQNLVLGGAAGAVGQKVGQVVGDKIGATVAARRGAAATAQSENAVRDATIAQSRKAGYVLPPATINQGSKTAVAAESLSGKAATQQTAAFRNQKVTNRLIRTDLGLKGGGQTSPAELAAVRKQAGKVYEAVSSVGRITPDQQYLDDVANLSDVLEDVAAEFPGASAPSAEKIRGIADSLFQEDFDARAAVKYVRSLREQAKANFQGAASAGGDAEKLALAHAQREAAGALEDMVLRHLRATGKGQLADSFDKARVTIAKAHDAEVALNPGTGNFDATKLGAKLRRNKPMSGNFETVAKFASAFRESAREQTTGPGVSALSAMLSGAAAVGGAATGNLPAMAVATLPFARSGARAAILSGPGQALAAPSYSASSPLLQLMQQFAPLSAPVGIGIANSK